MEFLPSIIIMIIYAIAVGVALRIATRPPEDAVEEQGAVGGTMGRSSAMRETGHVPHGGHPTPEMICLHCRAKGEVSTKPITRNAGISRPKVAAAVLTAGISIPVVGLSRRETKTQARCSCCQQAWIV